MEITPNEFEIILNLTEEKDVASIGLNGSPLKREFPDLVVPWKEKLKFPTVFEDFGLSTSGEIPKAVNEESSTAQEGGRTDVAGKVSIRVVNGSDIGDVPIEYCFHDLQDYELPVKGFFVDRRIIPGFRYTVRLLGSQFRLFGGKSSVLGSVGIGYGKRLTFSGETSADNVHFWSDSSPEGYAFNVDAVRPRDEFVICDETLRPLGRAYVESIILPQQEVSTSVEDGTATKRVKVTLSITAEYRLQRHGFLPLFAGETAVVNGTAIVVKQRREREAVTLRIENINLPMVGDCTLNKEI